MYIDCTGNKMNKNFHYSFFSVLGEAKVFFYQNQCTRPCMYPGGGQIEDCSLSMATEIHKDLVQLHILASIPLCFTCLLVRCYINA